MQTMNYDTRRLGIPHYPMAFEEIDNSRMAELSDMSKAEQKKRLLYVHIPFCDHVCPFCPYPKVKVEGTLRKKYLSALASEAKKYGEELGYQHNLIEAVYVGGGTPSVLREEEISALFSQLQESLNFSQCREMTFESNPATLPLSKIQLLKTFGVNRISLGVQTFNTKLAAGIGLLQTPEDSYRAFEDVVSEGITNISIDLMYNLPGQAMADWEADVGETVKLKPHHVTLYPFKVIPGFALFKQIQRGELPPQGDLRYEIQLYKRALEIFEANGYRIDTTYDFCLEGAGQHLYAERHFLDHMDIIALGLASFGDINGFVYSNKNKIPEYIDAVENSLFPVRKGYKVKESELPAQMLSMAMRYLKANANKFKERFGEHPRTMFPELLDKLSRSGLIEVTEDEIALTRLDGVIFGNNVGLEFCDKAYQDRHPL